MAINPFYGTPFFANSRYGDPVLRGVLSQYFALADPIVAALGVSQELRTFLMKDVVSWAEYQRYKAASPGGFPFNNVRRIEELPVMLSDKELGEIVEDFPDLEDLDLSGLVTVTHIGIKHLQNIPIKNLGLLRLGIDDRAMTHIKGMRSLAALQIVDCPNITDKGYEVVFSVPSLRTLDLTQASLNDSQIDWFKNHAGSDLARGMISGDISFKFCNLRFDTNRKLVFEALNDRKVIEYCSYNRVVESLLVNRCRLKPNGFLAIAHKNLKNLSLIESPVPRKFTFPAEFSRRLEKLTITKLLNADATYQAFTDSFRLNELKIMNCQCKKIRSLLDLLVRSSSIQKLSLCSIEISDELLEIISRMENLAQLTLANCHGYSTAGLQLLRNPSLRVLRLVIPSGLKIDDLVFSIQNLHLDELLVKGMTLRREQLDTFRNFFEKLKILYMDHRVETKVFEFDFPELVVQPPESV